MESDHGFQTALQEARKGAGEGGIPIGAALVTKEGKIIGQGHNMRVQDGSAIMHVRLERSSIHFASGSRNMFPGFSRLIAIPKNNNKIRHLSTPPPDMT